MSKIKHMKYILSVVLAIVLAFAPMSALKAKADELPPGVPELASDIIQHYALTGTIITETGETLTFPSETVDAHLKLDHDYNFIDEDAYWDAIGLTNTKLNNWAKEMGYEGLGAITSLCTNTEIVGTYYDAEGNIVSQDEYDYNTGYYADYGEETYVCKYYYNAQTGSSHECTYEVSQGSLDFDECMYDEVIVPVDCQSVDEITGVYVEDASTNTEGAMSVYFSDMFGMPAISLASDFFADLDTGIYTLVVMFTGDRVTSGTPLYVTKWSLDCIGGYGANYTPGSGEDLVLTFDAYPGEAIDHIALNGADSIPTESFSTVAKWDSNCIELHIDAEYLDSLAQSGVREALINPYFLGADRYSNAMFTMYSYDVIEGETQDYDAEVGGDVVIRIDGPDAEAEEVLVDGTAIDSNNYTITHGSTVVTLKDDYLSTLSAGEHKVKVNYSNGAQSDEATITVAQATQGGNEGGNTSGNEGGNEGGNTSGNEGGNTSGNDGGNTDSEGGNTGSEGGNTGSNTGNEGGNTGSNTGNEGGNTEGGNTQPAEKPEGGENTGKENGTTQNETGKESGKQDGSDKNSGKEITSGNKENSTDKNTEKKPNTGDNGVTVALALFMMSMVGICGAMYARKKAVRKN